MDVMRILVVENNPAEIQRLTEYLRADAAGRLEGTGAPTMSAALALRASGPFAAVLLDLDLSDGKGLVGIDRLAAGDPALPVIVLTGSEDEALALAALARGAQDVLTRGRIDGHTLVRCILQAIERHRAGAAARIQIEQVFKAMRDGVVLMELDGAITSMNPAAENLTGLVSTAVVGRNIECLLGIFLQGADLLAVWHGMKELRGGTIPDFPPLFLRRPDGKAFRILPSASFVEAPDHARRAVVLTLKDITELFETTQKMRELAGRLAAADEAERWRISRHIHDTIVQNLSLSSIRLGSMVKPLADTGLHAEGDNLRQVRDLLTQTLEECRMVMLDLTPSLLELGLIPALRDLARQLSAKHGVRVAIQDDGRETRLAPPLRGLLFQSVRELIINALKHAAPREIRVMVEHRRDELVVGVVDDGSGFDASRLGGRLDCKGGFGLLNIRQRVEGLGGRLKIDSTPGKGTIATISLPATL